MVDTVVSTHRIHNTEPSDTEKRKLPSLLWYNAWRTVLLFIIWSHLDQVRVPFLENGHHVFKAALEIGIDKYTIKVASLLSVELKSEHRDAGVRFFMAQIRLSPITNKKCKLKHTRIQALLPHCQVGSGSALRFQSPDPEDAFRGLPWKEAKWSSSRVASCSSWPFAPLAHQCLGHKSSPRSAPFPQQQHWTDK